MRELVLSKGEVAFIDDDDFEKAGNLKWWANHNGYAVRSVPASNGKSTSLFLHHLVLGIKPIPNHDVDHINGNRLDNRKSNLRICTKRQNSCNSKKKSSNTSGFKGASWCKRTKKWYSQIRINGKKTSLGFHETAELAHQAYCKAAIEHHKEFARFE